MWKWLRQIFQKKENNCCNIKIEEMRNTCESCVWWAAEEENNAPSAQEVDKRFDENYKFCDIQKQHTHKIHTCNSYIKEEFEATEDAISTEEFELNQELSVERK